ncbi:hypothetical protein NDU88_008883 [Pleurodeles waltl]|uniref:Uncharacterized protein n=1 Tax=Pleurodeles waltl TaxID=8319 RepID=A0AAV7RV35_PLEWA|nr:hypothetical protein NDU88_008883 [Pleurodeles waltl]
MCLPAAENAGIRSALQEGEAPGGRLRHWERALLELRRVRRGAARIPLRVNPSRASTSKVPGRNSQEPGSAATRAKQTARKEAIAAAELVGSSLRQSGGDWSPPSSFFFSPSQEHFEKGKRKVRLLQFDVLNKWGKIHQVTTYKGTNEDEKGLMSLLPK